MNLAEDLFARFPFAEISSQDGMSRLRFCTYGYERPQDIEGTDADWQRVYVHLNIPNFSAEFQNSALMGHELENFLRRLIEFSAMKSENVQFEPCDCNFKLKLCYVEGKKVRVSGQARSLDGSGNWLEFSFLSDLPIVDNFVAGIKGILSQFPPRG